MSLCKKKTFFLSFPTFFPMLLSLVIFALLKNTRAEPRSFFVCFFLLQRWRKLIINTFYAVSESKCFFVFLWHGVVGRPIKKLFCGTNVVFELNDRGDEREPQFEGSVSLGERKRLWFFLVILTLNAQKLQTGRKGFFICWHETCLPVWKNKNTR